MSDFEMPDSFRILELETRIQSMTSEHARVVRSLKERLEAARAQQEEDKKEKSRAEKLRREQEEKIRSQSTAIQELHRQTEERERIHANRMDKMRRQYEQRAGQLQHQFEAEQGLLRDALASTQSKMKEGFRKIRQETDQALEVQRRQSEEALARAQADFRRQTAAVDSKVNGLIQSLEAKEESRKEAARYWLEQLQRLIAELEDEYRTELFAPGRLDKLRQAARGAKEDMEGSIPNYTLAIGGARQAFYDALDVKDAVEQAEMEWNLYYHALREREDQLAALLEQAQTRSFEYERTLPDGTTEQILYEPSADPDEDEGVNYWTYGQLDLVREHIRQAREQLAEENLRMQDTGALQQHLQELAGLQEELALVESAALSNVAMAESRLDTAVQIGGVLGEGFLMVHGDGDYFAQENREAYHAVFENPATKARATVLITPLPDEHGVVTNHTEILFENADNDPAQNRRMNQAVVQGLAAQGLLKDGLPCEGRHGEKTRQIAAAAGNIEDVREGLERARAPRPAGH